VEEAAIAGAPAAPPAIAGAPAAPPLLLQLIALLILPLSTATSLLQVEEALLSQALLVETWYEKAVVV